MDKHRTSQNEKYESGKPAKQPPRRSFDDDEAVEVPKSSRYEQRMKFKKRDSRRDGWDDDDYDYDD
ncbi:MAG: hypothetical protein EP347_10250 [Alphaproteobacteria bacterium]|nr:MAG: hypothetical protein EP347_10250 [Alphaproteobacteria bacterium]